jgi:hypothetical protein
MFHRFTASARRVMQRAFREAKRQQHDFVGTEHLLYGLLCDVDGPAVTLLRAIGAKPDLMMHKVELSLERHDAGTAMDQFPLSPATRRVFRGAAEEAARFHHQMIGPEHLLLGLLREEECVAAQILMENGVAWIAAHDAVAHLSPHLDAEAQIHASEPTRFLLKENPSVDELERWVAPAVTHDDPANLVTLLISEQNAEAIDIEAQLRRTQLMLGLVMGYSFGHWLWGWQMGLFMAAVGVGVALLRTTWIGIAVGIGCGLFVVPIYHAELVTPLGPVFLGMLGALLGSFLGDGWRFSSKLPIQQPASLHDADHEPEPKHDAPENSQRRRLRSRQ